MIRTVNDEDTSPLSEILKRYFILDKKAEEYIKSNSEIQDYLKEYGISNIESIMQTTLPLELTRTITVSNLAELIGNSFYDTLAVFLEKL
jgi:hypothetical protein